MLTFPIASPIVGAGVRDLVMANPPKDQDELTEEEAAKRRDAVLKRMLNTPPKPHKAGRKTALLKRPQPQEKISKK